MSDKEKIQAGNMLEVRDLDVTFRSTGKHAVHSISLDMAYGERLGLVGESGSGKTVTAMAISGLIERNNVQMSGTVHFDGTNLMTCSRHELRNIQGRDIGVVFQEPMTSLNPLKRIGNQVEEALRIHTDLSAEERKKRALDALEMVGIPDPEGTYQKYPHQLSGGQRQRAMIASAMVIHPKLLICDEPTTALDVSVQAQILELLQQLSEEYGVGILLISHDLKVIKKLCERVYVMYRGDIVEHGETQQVFEHPAHEYTQHLIAAIPKRERKNG